MQELYQEVRKNRKLALDVQELNQEKQIYLPLQLSALSQNYQSCESKEINFEIEEILWKETSTVIFGQSGCGKTLLARKIHELILNLNEQIQIMTFFISGINDIEFDFRKILQKQLLFFNEEQIERFENDVLQNKIKVFVIIDDFDQFLLKNEQFLLDLRNSFLKSNGKFIYLTNTQVTKTEKYYMQIELENQIEKYEIIKLNKNDVWKYFENYFQSEKYILQMDLSQRENKKILKSIVRRLKNINNINGVLIKIIKLSSIVDNFEQEAGNAMTILKELKSIFKNQDFSNIRLKNSSFDDVSFNWCNFEGSQMNKVDISRCWFMSCNLNNVVWKNMRKNEVQFYVGNKESVISMAFTYDSKIVAAGFFNKRIELWHIQACKKLCDLRVNRVPENLIFSSNKQLLASCGYSGRIKIQSCQSRKTIRRIEKDSNGTSCVLAFSFDDQILAFVSGKIIIFWNMKVSKLAQKIEFHTTYIQQLAFSPDNKFLSSSYTDKTVQIWNIVERKQQLVLKGNEETVISMEFSPDSKYLATGRVDGYIKVWNVLTGKIEADFIFHNDQIQTLKFSMNGKYLASGGSEGTVVLWTLEEKGYTEDDSEGEDKSEDENVGEKDEELELNNIKNSLSEMESDDQSSIQLKLIKCWNLIERQPFKEQQEINMVHSLQFLPQENNVISGNKEGTIKIHNLRDNHQKKDDLNLFNCVTFSPSGKLFATCDTRRKIQFLDLEQGKFSRNFAEKSGGAKQIAFSFDEQILASRSSTYINIWCVSSGKLICKLANGHRGLLTYIVFSPTELILASGSEDKSIIIWDVEKQKQIKKLDDQDSVISQLAYSPCGKLLVSCGGYTIYLWDPNFGKLLKTFCRKEEVQTIAFSIDGQVLASGYSNMTIVLWDIKLGHQIQVMQGVSISYCLKFSPDSNLLASGNEDSIITILDLRDPQSPISLKGSSDTVNSIDFSPDGQKLASSSKDGSLYFWQIEKKMQNDVSQQNNENLNNIGYEVKISPLYALSRDFGFQAQDSSLKNSLIVSEKGLNLTKLFLQTGGHR